MEQKIVDDLKKLLKCIDVSITFGKQAGGVSWSKKQGNMPSKQDAVVHDVDEDDGLTVKFEAYFTNMVHAEQARDKLIKDDELTNMFNFQVRKGKGKNPNAKNQIAVTTSPKKT